MPAPGPRTARPRPPVSIDRFALVGHPVQHSWSPFIHGMFARQTGRDLQYRLIDATPEDFDRVVREFFAQGGKGLNVTVPHKQAAAALVDELTPRAARAGAVNTIAWAAAGGLLGDNTDGVGLVADLKDNVGAAITGQRILVLGAGGATRGVLGPLLDARPSLLCVANRSEARATELAARFAQAGPIVGCGYDAIPAGPYDLIINATSASLSGEVPPVPDHCMGPDTIAYDMAYAKEPTAFMRHATARGVRRTYLGWGMLVEQAAEAYLVWRGTRPQTAQVLGLLTSGAPGRA